MSDSHGAPPGDIASPATPLRATSCVWGCLGGEMGWLPRTVIATFLGYVLWMVAVPAGPAHQFLSELYNIVVPLAATAAAWWTARSPALEPRTRQGWLAGGIGTLMLAAGCTVWFVDDYVIGNRPAVSVADALYLLYYPALLWGLLRLPRRRRTRGDLIKLWLDVGTVAVTGGAIIWHLVIDPQVDTGSVSLLGVVLSAAYPVGDLIILFATVALLLHHAPSVNRRALQLLTVAGACMFWSDLVLGYRVVHTGQYHMGGWTDLGWQSAMMLWILAALHQRWSVARADTVGDGSEASARISVIPYAAVLTGYGLLAEVAWPYWHALDEVILPVLLLTVLVLVRQIIAVRENTQAMNDHLTQEARFRSLVQNSSDVITVIDEQGIIQFMSPAVERVLGWLPSAAVGRHVRELVHRDDRMALSAFLDNVQSGGDAARGAQSVITRCRRRGGEWCTVETVATLLTDDPVVQGIVLNSRDVSERMALQAALSHQAHHDSLTQLANRSWFHLQVEHALEHIRQGTGHIAVLFLDLDDFKSINDSFGHAEGDAVLMEVARRLLDATRGSDTVARLGGDEFAVLVGRINSEGDLRIVANRIINAMQAPFQLPSGEVVLSASVGIAQQGEGSTVGELLRDADVAMYVSKRQGKGRYTLFEPRMHAQALARRELETGLRYAPVRDELVLLFQPIVSLRDGALAGVEALVRWQHPRRGLLPPSEFVPLAEESGLILPLGQWVLTEACQHGARWRSLLPASAPFTVAVNVSGRQLEHAGFVDDVAATLEQTGLPAHDLLLEVTESVIARDMSVMLRRLKALKGLGVRLAIDDFGTGYSSLSALRQFPVDVLKIDKCFIDDALDGDENAALIRTIVSLGETLSLQTIAEGVERQQQADALSAIGCGFAQGFYFSRPLRALAIDDLVRHEPGATVVAPVDVPRATGTYGG